MGKKSAFTLIELLVVIAVIALLMAILVPALSRARKHAKAAVCLSHLKQWGTTFALYTQDNEGHLPAHWVEGVWMLRGAFTGQAGPNEPQIRQNVRTEGIACCPMATQPADKAGGFRLNNNQVEGTAGAVFGAWEITRPAPAFRASYGLNGSLFRPLADWTVSGTHGLETNTFSIKGMASIPVLLDSALPYAEIRATDTPLPDPSRLWPGMGAFCLDRHDTRVGGLFLDWSVRKIGLKGLWTLKWTPTFNTAGRWTKAGGVTPEQWPAWMRGFRDY